MTAKKRAIKERLQQLERTADGVLTPTVVVEDASNPESILHDQFEWDDAKAAHAHRLDQARVLIRSVRYEEVITDVELPTPRYVHVTFDAKPDGYMNVDRVKAKAELAREVLNDEIKRASAALERARNVSDALGLRDDLEAVLVRLVAIQAKAA